MQKMDFVKRDREIAKKIDEIAKLTKENSHRILCKQLSVYLNAVC